MPREPSVELVALAEPRPLAAEERALVEFLVAGPLGKPELVAQAESAVVVATSRCGCPAVGLAVDPTLPPARFDDGESRFETSGYVALTARQADALWPEVTLHVGDGRLAELEIWGGEYGVRPKIDPRRLEHDSPER